MHDRRKQVAPQEIASADHMQAVGPEQIGQPWAVGDQDPVLIVDHIGQGGAAKAAIQDRDDAVEGRGTRAVGGLEGVDLGLEPSGIECRVCTA
jgi:hypothetical protein